MPRCWDQWFPELGRAYALGGADLLAYPTAIGCEPLHPAWDTRPERQRSSPTPSPTACCGHEHSARVGGHIASSPTPSP